MNPKQERFVAEYLKDLNATQAAIRAGYTAKWAEKNAHRLTGNDGIKAAIERGTRKQLEKSELSASRILEELRRLALVDMREFFDTHGNLKSIKDLTPEQGSCLASVEVVVKNLVAGDGQVDMVHKVKAWDKVRALEMLAKHFKLLVDRVEVTGDEELVRLLQSARKRAAAVR